MNKKEIEIREFEMHLKNSFYVVIEAVLMT